MSNKQSLILSSFFVLLMSCATYKLQIKEENEKELFPIHKKIAHTFYFIGDAGNSPIGEKTEALQVFEKSLSKATKNSTAIFLGDNVYPKGVSPNKKDKNRAFTKHQLQVQSNAVKDFKGNTIFIPGNHDWYSGLKGLKLQEKFIEDKLGKNTFLPENGCPIKKVKINDEVELIVIDSQWYLTNWNKHPRINDNCEIKTRTQFFDEFGGMIKKARGKTTLVVLHHPMFTNGAHGGQYSIRQHLKPFPVLGTIKNVLRKTAGLTNVDQINEGYNTLIKRIVTLSKENEKVVFVSGHDHSLQYLVQNDLPQIISGSGSKISETRNVGEGKFSYGAPGYARLDVFEDGSSYVRFFITKSEKAIFGTTVFSKNKEKTLLNYETDFPKNSVASIYKKKETTKSKFYKTLWGSRYRDDYSVKVTVPTVNLDTLFGGVKPKIKGGGNQSKSLRLEDLDGREYVMRALRKNSVQFLQAVAFKDQYIKTSFSNTFPERLLNDAFTGSHPYAPFVIGKLADAIGVYHTNPKLYYVPKQKALKGYNIDFGDELYMIEERAASGHGNNASFGFSNKIISTFDMLKNLKKDQKYEVDEQAYIKARLFDMLIGDWDRHEDQWRWATFKEGDKIIYRPIPRDRDQAFSIMDDGFLLSMATTISPDVRLLKSYESDLRNPKWINTQAYPLDVALINESDKKTWDSQVAIITQNITDKVIEEAFEVFPLGINQESLIQIKQKLKGKRKNLQKISDAYFKQVNKYAVVRGTNKDDWFDIERKPNGETKITGYRIKKGKKDSIFHQRTYNCKSTKEIWIYGLDDDDVFSVFGKGDDLITTRLIGGQNKDTYTIENGKRLKVYDYKTKKSVFETKKGKRKLTNDYKTNTYNHKKLKHNVNQFLPFLGFNPDDGVKISAINTYTVNGFERNPFTSQHNILASYYFATSGFDVKYNSEFANVIGNLNVGFEAIYSSPNYSINFFGFGNETQNFNKINDDDFGLNYNRVRLSTLKIAPFIMWKNRLGALLKTTVNYEKIEVDRTENRFIAQFLLEENIANRNDLLGISSIFKYKNKDNKAFPTLGINTSLEVGYTQNLSNSNGISFIKSILGFNYKLSSNGKLVLATQSGAHINFGNDFQFYQGANLGANNGLRGYRNQRFTGRSAFYETTDLRFNFKELKTRLIPIHLGIYGGVDVGRVWFQKESSNKWNNSYGGGFFINGANLLVGNASLFNAKDGLRFAFQLGFGF